MPAFYAESEGELPLMSALVVPTRQKGRPKALPQTTGSTRNDSRCAVTAPGPPRIVERRGI